ncbi:MAG: sigma-E processing peptidase SpoIIGA [Clostridiales bacterium]|jgi:stage II sporulation protein GA (sporulation sigma-E factor processing peptidase)|nr:sigma-E processing peptidase SpoIIGA [Clostridiales bacterium]
MYIEDIFLVNMLMTYGIIMITKFLVKQSPKTWRVVLSSVFSGVYSVLIYLPNLTFLNAIVFKLFLPFILLYIVFGFISVKEMFKEYLAFLLSSFAISGVVYAVIGFTKNSRYSIWFLLISFLVSYGIIFIVNRCKQKKEDIIAKIVNIKIFKNEKVIETDCLIDTGCNLKDPFTGELVLVVENCVVNPDFISGIAKKIIPYKVLGNTSGFLNAYRVDEVLINDCRVNINNIAIVNQKLSNDGLYKGLCPYIDDFEKAI